MVAALGDDAHVAEQKARYAARRAALLAGASRRAGSGSTHSEAGLYLWATRGRGRAGRRSSGWPSAASSSRRATSTARPGASTCGSRSRRPTSASRPRPPAAGRRRPTGEVPVVLRVRVSRWAAIAGVTSLAGYAGELRPEHHRTRRGHSDRRSGATTLSVAGQGARPVPVVDATEGNDGYDISAAAQGDRATSPSTRLREHRVAARARSPTSTATRASCATAATRSSSWPSSRTLPRDVATCSSTASCRRRPSSTSSSDRIRRHTLLHEDLKRFFDGFPRDAHPMAVLSLGGHRAVDLLPGQPRPLRPGAGRALDRPAAGQAADDRGVRATRSRSASRSSTPTTRCRSSRTSCG